jgi:hypothetical protein
MNPCGKVDAIKYDASGGNSETHCIAHAKYMQNTT